MSALRSGAVRAQEGFWAEPGLRAGPPWSFRLKTRIFFGCFWTVLLYSRLSERKFGWLKCGL